MKIINLLSCFFLICLIEFALAQQKKTIDTTAYLSWPEIEAPKISNDGKYLSYIIQNKPIGSCTMVFQSVDGKWKKEFIDAGEIQIASNSKSAAFIKGKDSLVYLKAGTNSIQYIPNVSSFEINGRGKNEQLCYILNDIEKTLVLKNISMNKENSLKGVEGFSFSKNGKMFILKTRSKTNPALETLIHVNVGTMKKNQIWQGKNAGSLVFDTTREQLAFKSDEGIWVYKYGDSTAICAVDGNLDNFFPGGKLVDVRGFDKNGVHLYFSIKEPEKLKPRKAAVEVWSYKDVKLQSEQQSDLINGSRAYLFVLNLVNNKVTRLQYEDENLGNDLTKETVLVEHRKNGIAYWIENEKSTWTLMSLFTGKRIPLAFLSEGDVINHSIEMSGDEKFVIFFKDKNYFTYEIATKVIRNITKDIPVSWMQLNLSDGGTIRPRGVPGWLKNDESVLLYDQNDIWKIDPLQKVAPVNLTNGYGLKNHIVFNLGLDNYEKIDLSTEQGLILNAFNIENKDNGYYTKRMEKMGDPVPLGMGPYIYQLFNMPYIRGYSNYPIKAKNADCYLVKRSMSTQSANYFLTTDFRSFKQMTSIEDEKHYNWYTTELHNWKSLDGQNLQGILYKPENFDPKKRYPVIFYYYERLSEGLNASLKPEFSEGQIDIPTYVSNGYLVFSPDIHYTIGNPMQGTYDAVVSAARYVSALPFVNSKKLGLQGHSFGALQTNYLVTHTNLFAAACSASGLSDLVSGYGSIWGGIGNQQGVSFQAFFEKEQIRMGRTLWEDPDAYIRNSPVFQVNKVVTPLLMMHGKKDDVCLYGNATEFFTGLRRLGKKVWMLVYPEGNHSIFGDDAKDFTIRMSQFFDHYLLDKPAPKWMLDGIPAQRNGIDDGLTPDNSGRIPGPGLVTQKQQEKANSLIR